VAVAREGEEETPSVPAPPALRPFLRFAKLPNRALAVTRRALEADSEFRSRVADAVKDNGVDVGRAGFLYLTRPEGWEEELEELVAGAEESARAHADRRAEHDARRRLAGVQEAARRAEQAAATARAEAAEAGAALAEERRARQAAIEASEATARRADALEVERDNLRAAVDTAAAEQERLRQRVADLERRLAEAQAEIARLAAQPPPPAAVAVPAPVVAREIPGLAEAAEAAAVLAERLQAAIAALAGAAADPQPLSPAPPPPPTAAAAAIAVAAPRPPRAPVRRPAPLPPAVYDDSPEAADHLVRLPGVVLVVDGYNVSKTGWPELPLNEQRRRLVDALAELAARTGADVRAVFDGSDMAMPGIVPTTAKLVKVIFSPPGVEADEVVMELAAQLPVHRPVVAATNDRRVRVGASRAGANLISSEQLLGLLRR
jgi:predicted RNA-binding protein with PIN domain